MKLEIIEKMEDFDRIHLAWQEVYQADPQAQIFVSWCWLQGFLRCTKHHWLVLGLKQNKDYVAFLPLMVSGKKRIKFNVLRLAGSPFADHTGMVCLPEYKSLAVELFSDYIAYQIEWDQFNAREVFDPRMEAVIDKIPKGSVNIKKTEPTTCPFLFLPESWETYTARSMNKNTFYNLGRSLKKLERLPNFRYVPTSAENVQEQVEMILKLWKARWNLGQVERYRLILKQCFKSEILHLTTLQNGNEPIAASCAFSDESKKTYSMYISSFNPDYGKYSPGKLILMLAIQYAIEHGYQTFDFLRGANRVKYTFGAEDRYNQNYVITRSSIKSILTNKLSQVIDQLPGAS